MTCFSLAARCSAALPPSPAGWKPTHQHPPHTPLFEHLDPLRTSLVVVDIVPFNACESAYVRGIVPRVNALASALRTAGGTVAWVVPGWSEPRQKDREFFGDEVAERYAASGRGGVDPSLAVSAEDLVVEKTGRSAWTPGSSDLPRLLSDRSIDTIVVTGTVTNVCVEHTVRDASAAGLRVVLVADACAATHDDAHNATLRTIYRSYGDVRPTTEVLDLIASGAAGRAASVSKSEPLPDPSVVEVRGAPATSLETTPDLDATSDHDAWPLCYVSGDR